MKLLMTLFVLLIGFGSVNAQEFKKPVPWMLVQNDEDATSTDATWAFEVASNLVTFNKSAAADSSYLYFPLDEREATSAQINANGLYVKSFTLHYSIATDSLNANPAIDIVKITIDPDSANTAATVTETQAVLVGDYTTRYNRVGEYTIRATITTPVWVQDTALYYAKVFLRAKATTVVKLHDAYWLIEGR